MRSTRCIRPLLVACLVIGAVAVPVPVAAAVVTASVRSAAAPTPQQAIDQGARHAADAQGARTYAAVVDRATGKIVAETDNADEQVASESIVKLFLVAYYLVQSEGKMDADLEADMHEMIVRSDDTVANTYWTTEAVPTITARYHLTGIENDRDDPDRWGGTRITAEGMALFLYRMSLDPEVGPWLVPTMRETQNLGIDGYDQNFGFNALVGVANKQGWGSDNFSDQANAVHSVGLTQRYAAAVLQTGPVGTYRSMGVLATETAGLIAGSTPPAPATPAAPAPVPATPAAPATPVPAPPTPGGGTSEPPWWADALEF